MKRVFIAAFLLTLMIFTIPGPGFSQHRMEFRFSNSDKAIAHYNIAVNFAKKGELQKAIKEFEISHNLDSSNPSACYNLGVAYANLNQFEKAIDWYKKVLSIKPDDAVSYLNIGVSLSNLERYAEAEKYYLKAIEIDKNMPEAHANLAIVYLNKNNRTKYNEELAILEKINPTLAEQIKRAGNPVIINKPKK